MQDADHNEIEDSKPSNAPAQQDAELVERQRRERLEQQQRAELEQKAKAQHERLERRAEVLAAVIASFLKQYEQAWVTERQAAAKKAAGGTGGSKGSSKPKGKSKKGKDGPDKGKATDAKGSGGNEAPQRPPMMQAWFTLFTELDDKVNKAKRAGPEDMLRAMGKLQPSGLQLLSNLAATASSKQLASLELAEPLLLLKEAMFGAAAAAAAARAGEGYQGSGCWDACRSAESFRAAGLPASAAHKAGHQPPKLLHAGYSTADVIACGASLAQLHVAEVSVKDLVSAPATAARLAGWQGAQQLLLAGYSPAQLARSGAYDIYELAKAGATEEQLRSAGCAPAAVRQAGLGPPHAQPLQPSAAGIKPVMQVTAGQLHTMWPGWGPGGPRGKAGLQAQGRPRSGSSASGTTAGRSRPGSAVARQDGSSSQVDVAAEGSVLPTGRPHSAALVRVMREALGSPGGSNAGSSGGGGAMHSVAA